MTSLERGLESQIDKNVFILFGESLTDYELVIEGYEYHLPLLDSKKNARWGASNSIKDSSREFTHVCN